MPGQLINPSALVMVPLPPVATVSRKVLWVKVAVTVRAVLVAKLQMLPLTESQPSQLMKNQP